MAEFVINDSNIHLLADHPSNGLCGTLPRKTLFGSLPFAQGSPPDLIAWEAMPDMIADQERNKSSLEHIWADSKIGILNQGQLNYCWMFSAAMALMLEREMMGLEFIPLSASSIGAPLVGYQNVGGYIEDALKAMVDQGAASTAYVPAATNNAADFKPGWRESASQNKVTMWTDLRADMQAQLSTVLNNRPMPTGINSWGHSVCFIRALDRNPKLPVNNPRRYGFKFPNSWANTWGDKGFGIIEGRPADQAYGLDQAKITG